MQAKLEYHGLDTEFPGAHIWAVEAIHVTTTRNKRKYTKSELISAARSLSFRPLNINHESSRQLPFPENATLFMEFDESTNGVKGKFRVLDSEINRMIKQHEINQVSIEQLPTKGETCNDIFCEQHGIAFIGMALVESHLLTGDPNANIIRETFTIEEILVSDEQRTCKECTDFKMCETCIHKKENDKCVEDCLRAKKDKGVKIDDQAIAICLSECGKSNKQEVWEIYKKFQHMKN